MVAGARSPETEEKGETKNRILLALRCSVLSKYILIALTGHKHSSSTMSGLRMEERAEIVNDKGSLRPEWNLKVLGKKVGITDMVTF